MLSFSSEVSRGCSSRENVSMPFFAFISMGVISATKNPFLSAENERERRREKEREKERERERERGRDRERERNTNTDDRFRN